MSLLRSFFLQLVLYVSTPQPSSGVLLIMSLFTPGHRLLLESFEVTGESSEPPSRVGQCKLGAVHHLLHSSYTSAGLRPVVQEGPGAGEILSLIF